MLIIEPCAGLANRILALATAYRLAGRTGHKLKVLWDVDGTVGAGADELFRLPDDIQVITMTKAPAHEKPLLWLKSRCLRTIYRSRCGVFLDCGDIVRKKQGGTGLDLEQLLRENRTVYIKSFCELESIEDRAVFRIFRPAPEILEKGKEVFAGIGPDTVGMHIRRTDHAEAIAHSPTALFFDKVKELLSDSADSVYLATDDMALEKEMREQFPGKIITYRQKEFSRKSKGGMQDSVVDLLALSRCSRIYGSYGSTFSRMASYIGGCELIILEDKSE